MVIEQTVDDAKGPTLFEFKSPMAILKNPAYTDFYP
jgi:hypothetical protein